jgi:hypothetical protein
VKNRVCWAPYCWSFYIWLPSPKVFFTADDVKSFRTLDLQPGNVLSWDNGSRCSYHLVGLKLLGFKDNTELAFEDNIKHSIFIYPDEMVGLVFFGSCRCEIKDILGLLGEYTHLQCVAEVDVGQREDRSRPRNNQTEQCTHLLRTDATSKFITFKAILETK